MFDFRDWAYPFKMYPNIDLKMFRKIFLEKQKRVQEMGQGNVTIFRHSNMGKMPPLHDIQYLFCCSY